MNIFILDENMYLSAQYHVDAHTHCMTKEAVQIICSSLHWHGYTTPYRPTHLLHPCVLWAAGNRDNFDWLVEFAYILNEEYKYRYNRATDHSSIYVLDSVVNLKFQTYTPRFDFAQAMPIQYQVPGNAVEAYRNYYRGDKRHIARWTKRSPPWWWY